MSATELAPAERLNEILMADDVATSLWAAIDSGRIDALVPVRCRTEPALETRSGVASTRQRQTCSESDESDAAGSASDDSDAEFCD